MWTRFSEDAVLFPLQRADTDPALHWTVCQHHERMSGKNLNDYALTACIYSNTQTRVSNFFEIVL